MSCTKCGASRLVHLSGKTADRCWVGIPHLNHEADGYSPHWAGEYGDYITLCFCADCGVIQDSGRMRFPISDEELVGLK